MHLQADEFFCETRLFPELAYTFKHALTQEVAYGSLLRERRQTLHARIVEAVECGQRALALATALGDAGTQVIANFYVVSLSYDLGDYRRPMDFLGWNVASLEADLIRERFGMTGLPCVLSDVYLSWSLAELGAFAEGVASGTDITGMFRIDQSPSILERSGSVRHSPAPRHRCCVILYIPLRGLAYHA